MGGNLAIIPVRTGSKRLRLKNIRHFFGKPIFVYTLEYAKRSGLFDEILVSTESNEVIDICRQYGHDVPFLRPEHLAIDTAQLVQVVADVLHEYELRNKIFDNFCLLWATAPMRTDDDLQKAYRLLEEKVEAVVGVTDYDLPVFCALKESEVGFLEPLFEEYQKLPSDRQPKAVVDNSSMCWCRVSAFRKYGTWMPPLLRGYWMPRSRSVDIDTEDDWELVEFYFRKLLDEQG